MSFADRVTDYQSRVDQYLDRFLPASTQQPQRLHEAMRYAVFNGGKRMRPLLVYATAEAVGLPATDADAAAAAVELIHAFSLVHDDLPAMDDDALRRGKPTVHIAFDEATAILAADALQPLAFEILTIAGTDTAHPARWLDATRVIANACGSLGMTGGQALDLAAEGREVNGEAVEAIHRMKTGCLIVSAVEAACALAASPHRKALVRFAQALGLAFQVRDDILDIESDTETLGKQQGADIARDKATWPAVYGLAEAKLRCRDLFDDGLSALRDLDGQADSLRWLAHYIVEREH